MIWGQGEVDLAVNRRERRDGETVLGWNPDELVDNQVTTLQLRRDDESVIATVVGYGCHPVTTGHDLFVYSADFPGAIRQTVRAVTGGECVFLQGAAGNVLPRVAFLTTEDEARRVGDAIAVTALASVAGRCSVPVSVSGRGVRLREQVHALPSGTCRRAGVGARCRVRVRRHPADATAERRGGTADARGVRSRARGGARLR